MSGRIGRGKPGAFYGGSGTVFNGAAREQIERDRKDNASHGDTAQTGNNVDFSQRHAQSEADEYTEQAERMTRSMERSDSFKYSGQFADPEKRREFVEQLAERLRNPDGNGQKPAQPQEPEEEPWSSDAFWNDKEELKKAGRAVRPEKL